MFNLLGPLANPAGATLQLLGIPDVARLETMAKVLGSLGVVMSRAFLRDDAEGEMPRRNYGLPARDDPEYDRVAARALLEAARVSETQLAERATGYYWGEPRLRPYVEEVLAEAERAQDDRLEQVARRFLK